MDGQFYSISVNRNKNYTHIGRKCRNDEMNKNDDRST